MTEPIRCYRPLLYGIIGLWFIAFLFLLGGFFRLVIINNETSLIIATVETYSYAPLDGTTQVKLIVHSDYLYAWNWFVVGYFNNGSLAQAYLDEYWPIASLHPCYFRTSNGLSLTPFFEFWALIVAGVLLIVALALATLLIVFTIIQRWRRKAYRQMHGDDLILVSSDELPSEPLRPSKNKRSSMNSFEDAQILIWTYRDQLYAKLPKDDIDRIFALQLEAMIGSAELKARFQQEAGRLLRFLG